MEPVKLGLFKTQSLKTLKICIEVIFQYKLYFFFIIVKSYFVLVVLLIYEIFTCFLKFYNLFDCFAQIIIFMIL